MQDMVKHIHELLENLLTWTSSQRGKIEFNPVEFNLETIININTNLHKEPAARKNIKLVNNCTENVKAHADREMINTVVRNLMNNAVKFTPQFKSIEIGVRTNNGFCEVYVQDEGIGISDMNIEKLFRIDQKFKNTGTEGEKGTGLGLILCKEFVEKNGGEISVKSTEGKGTRFSFTVPIA